MSGRDQEEIRSCVVYSYRVAYNQTLYVAHALPWLLFGDASVGCQIMLIPASFHGSSLWSTRSPWRPSCSSSPETCSCPRPFTLAVSSAGLICLPFPWFLLLFLIFKVSPNTISSDWLLFVDFSVGSSLTSSLEVAFYQ